MQVAKSLKSMFSVRCPSFLRKPKGAVFTQDYETSTSYQESGTRVSDVEPFCGRSSSYNPEFLYKEGSGSPSVNLLLYGTVSLDIFKNIFCMCVMQCNQKHFYLSDSLSYGVA